MSYVVLYSFGNHLYRFILDEGTQVVGYVKDRDRDRDIINVPELGEARIKFKFKENCLTVSSNKIAIENKEITNSSRMVRITTNPDSYVMWDRYKGKSNRSYRIGYDSIVHVGREKTNDVIIGVNTVGKKHLIIRSHNGEVVVEDLNSTNGTYVNGSLIRRSALRSGDVIDILFVRMIYRESTLYFDNVGFALELNDVKQTEGIQSDPGNTGYLVYRRSPRIRELLPSDTIKLSQVPMKNKYVSGRNGMRIAPFLTTGAMVGASVLSGGFSAPMLAMRGAMLASPIGSLVTNQSGKQRKRDLEAETERLQKYGEYINGEKAKINAVGNQQRRIINNENPLPEKSINILNTLNTRLWERKPSDNDFLNVRIGQGYEPLCVDVKAPSDYDDFRMDRDELEDVANQVIQETRLVDDVATRVNLLRYNSVGIVGDRSKVIDLVKNMLVSLTAEHYFKDVRIIGIFDPEEKGIWSSIRWLPHVWDAEYQTRYLNFDEYEDDSLMTEQEKADSHYYQFCGKIDSILALRDDEEFKKSNKEHMPSPHYIFIMGSRLKTEKLELNKFIEKNDPNLGVTTIYLYDKQNYLPSTTQFIIDVDDNYDPNMANAFDTNAANEKLWFMMDKPLDMLTFDKYCRRMSAIRVDESKAEGEVPASLTFMECLGVSTVEQINAWENWNSNSSANGLAAPIGQYAIGKTYIMDNAYQNRAHGLVAGMTGAGKSELLLSWILSIACRFSPYDVNFVVVDYKGGSMAQAVENLPHVVGTIKNSGEGIERCFKSLCHEIKRREMILADNHLEKISQYIDGFHKGIYSEPLPRLMIVMDEFKELKKERPNVMAMVDSIAALGRSLGIHLVLATQSPEDSVDDGTWKNVSFSLCLKVKNAAASKAMIRNPDAAMISQSGRAYVRIGTDEHAEDYRLVQTAWSGAPYRGNETIGGMEVRIVDIGGERRKTVSDDNTRFRSDRKQIDVISEYLVNIAEENEMMKLPPPWKPELPVEFPLDIINVSGGFNGEEWVDTNLNWLQVPIGIYDLPSEQMQGVKCIDFVNEGNYGIFGAPGKGKTTLLKTIVVSLCRFYSPNDVNIYVLDFGNWGLSSLKDFPHVGEVVLDGDDDKFNQLMKRLTEQLDMRRKLFLEAGVNSLSAYRENVRDDLPALFVVIDNFASVTESFPDSEKDFIKLVKHGITVGIYVLYTGNNTSGVKYKVLSGITGAIAFALADKGDYNSLIGNLDGVPKPNRPGRALFKTRGTPLDIAVAMHISGKNDVERNMNLKELMNKMSDAWDGNKPSDVPVLPDVLTVDKLVEKNVDKSILPLGIGIDEISPVGISLQSTNSLLVVGNSKDLIVSATEKIVRVIEKQNNDAEFYVLKSAKSELKSISSIGKHACYDDNTGVNDLLIELANELNKRKQTLKESENSEEKQIDFSINCIVVEDLAELVQIMNEDDQKKFYRILDKAKQMNLLLLAAISTDNLLRLNGGEAIVSAFVKQKFALLLSDSMSTFKGGGFDSESVSVKTRYEPIEPGKGALFTSEGVIRLKFIDS